MAKNIFKRISVKDLGKPLKVRTSFFDVLGETGEASGEEDVKGSGVVDMVVDGVDAVADESLEDEISRKERELEEDIEKKRAEFEQEIEKTKTEAENFAFAKIKESTELYEAKLSEADALSTKRIEDAELEANRIMEEAKKKAQSLESQAYEKGFKEGQETGFNEGREEIERVTERLNVVLSTAIKKRSQIVEETEGQIIDIVLTIARKVVKSISETQKRVVYDNITEALSKLKGRTEVTIRVNTQDLQMTTKHKKEFIQMLEGIDHVKILEDNSVEKGGCYISTDFGTVDARISTQLSEIEEQIRKLSPQREEL